MDSANLRPLDIRALNPPLNVTVVQDGIGIEKLRKCVERIRNSSTPDAGTDTETNITVDFWNRRIRTMQFGDKDEQFVIDLLAFADGNSEKLINSQGHYGKYNGELYEPFLKHLRPVYESNKVLKCGINLGFEYEQYKWNLGIRMWHLFSVDMAERVIRAGIISLKKYSEFSMESLVARYFQMLIDKSEQENFNLTDPLTQKQIDYAALDTRIPLPLRQKVTEILVREHLMPTSIIENDAIPAYVDMHLNGQRIHEERWLKRIEKTLAERAEQLHTLDDGFIPIVGRKSEAIDEAEITRRDAYWRTFDEATPAEKEIAARKRQTKDATLKEQLDLRLKELVTERKAKKAEAKEAWSTLSKDRTQKRKILPKCEGEAFINYGSGKQLLEALQKMKGLSKLDSTSDDALLHYNDRPLIQVLRKYKKGKKDTGTYGVQWTKRWLNKPCKEEGWLHPGDGRLHCLFNQLEAETGRSSSSKPNAQNLPKDDEVRACFICDPPDESIRISDCCESETTVITGDTVCQACGKPCTTHAEQYCVVTCDMSGAELRIIAELANAKSWIQAFAKGWDVHSVSTEILEPEKWPALQVKSKLKPQGWTLEDCKTERIPILKPDGTPALNKKGKPLEVSPCMYYALGPDGQPARQKCDCPGHAELRQKTKSINFLLCYGGGPDALADELGITVEAAKELMEKHRAKFPDVWGYLERSGELAQRYKEARDMYGRRRAFPEPTPERAREWIIDEKPERLELDEEVAEQNIFEFKTRELREPTCTCQSDGCTNSEHELFWLTHRQPGHKEIMWGMRALMGSIGRRGKNHCIQGTNASIIKRAMGCGFDAKEGKPFLWHTLPQFKAKLLSMVHDELIVQCPLRYGEKVKALIGDAFKRAAAEVMKQVIMEFDGHVADRWMK